MSEPAIERIAARRDELEALVEEDGLNAAEYAAALLEELEDDGR